MQTLKKYDSVSQIAYTARLKAAFEPETKSPIPLVNVSLSILIVLLFLQAITFISPTGVRSSHPTLTLIILLAIMCLIGIHFYLQNRWVEETKLLQSNLTTVFEELFSVIGEESPDLVGHIHTVLKHVHTE